MPIPLSKAVFPLRYDVWEQAPVVKRLAHLEGDELLEAGRGTAIYHHIIIANPVYLALQGRTQFMGEALGRRNERYFRAHMRKLFTLYHSIKEGWNTGEDRLYYKKVVNPTTTTAGYIVPGDGLFLTNGQHRTTALMALGYTELPDFMAGIRIKSAVFLPLDLTEAYVKANVCTEERYVAFARYRYDIPGYINDIKGLLAWSKETSMPDWFLKYIEIYWGQK